MVGAGRRKKGGVAGGSSNANPDAAANNSSQSRPTFEAGGFDGPNDPPGSVVSGSRETGRGRQSSQSARPGASRPGSQTRGSSQVRGSSRPAEGRKEDKIVFNRNVDFGGSVYGMPGELMKRTPFGVFGKPAAVSVNSHRVEQWPDKDVYQYDIIIGSGQEKRGLVNAIWNSKIAKAKLDNSFIFDGKAIGWSLKNLGELKLMVDLDADQDRKPRNNKPDVHRLHISPAKNTKVRLAVLKAYLEGQISFSEEVLQCINFFDHLLRETPSKGLINLRRSYFSRTAKQQDRTLVGGGVEALKGVYQSLRAAEGRKLVVNVDVSNSCFWHEVKIDTLAYQLSGRSNQTDFMNDATYVRQGQREPVLTPYLKRLVRNRFYIKHRGGAGEKLHTIQKISNLNAKTYKFMVRDKADPKKETEMSIFQYYNEKYNVRLEKWALPLLETGKKGEAYPMELAYMASGQRYPFKLNEDQTSKMIKFAVSRPPIRKAAIEQGLAMLKWQEDPVLKTYGLKINPSMIVTKARVLEPPEVQFLGSTAQPKLQGRWDLRGKKFFKPGDDLVSWGVCVLSGAQGGDKRFIPSEDQLKTFITSFVGAYRNHGGRVKNPHPTITKGVMDTAEAISQAYYAAGNQAKAIPQMLLVVLTNRNAEIYQRVKKNCDCKFGIMSQCVQAGNVQKNSPQYCSNVLMKFNCKLGGTTSTVKHSDKEDKNKGKKNPLKADTMIIGADVSHPGPGAPTTSMAALTMSMDETCSRYAAAVQSNGYRVEMLSSANIMEMVPPLLDYWMKNVSHGKLPPHVYYFRDGVSEGQYTALLKQEVADLKKAMSQVAGGKSPYQPKFTVVVAEKRHHIRFFPSPGPSTSDKNGNPVPGTIVDRDVTHPFENDVYLCSHAAIQGTARPTHYTMLMDEMKVSTDDFQTLLYDHCYGYQRATTPVSLFPAVYYAHLAAARAAAHENKAEIEKWLIKSQLLNAPGVRVKDSSTDEQSEAPKLLGMENKNKIRYGMWYI